MEEPKKMLVFLQISLPFFLITYAWERVATFFVLSTLHWWAYSVMAWCLVEKWAIGKLVRLWFHRVSSISLKYVTYRQKITKIRFWALNSIFHTYFVYGIMLAYTTISFSNMYDTYRATCKKWRLCPRELWVRCEKWKCWQH